MPIYEYRCATCEGHVEVLIRPTTVTPVCPNCGSPLTHKLFSVPHVVRSEPRRPAGHTCCGREERCDTPPCSGGGDFRRD